MPLLAPKGCVVLSLGRDLPPAIDDTEAWQDDPDPITWYDDSQWLIPAEDVATLKGLRKTIEKYFNLVEPKSLYIVSNTVAGILEKSGRTVLALIHEKDWERLFQLGVFDHISIEDGKERYWVYVSMGPWEVDTMKEDDADDDVETGRRLKRLREA